MIYSLLMNCFLDGRKKKKKKHIRRQAVNLPPYISVRVTKDPAALSHFIWLNEFNVINADVLSGSLHGTPSCTVIVTVEREHSLL